MKLVTYGNLYLVTYETYDIYETHETYETYENLWNLWLWKLVETYWNSQPEGSLQKVPDEQDTKILDVILWSWSWYLFWVSMKIEALSWSFSGILCL